MRHPATHTTSITTDILSSANSDIRAVECLGHFWHGLEETQLSKKERELQMRCVLSAYKLADEIHRGDTRDSSEPYIHHPLEMLKIDITGEPMNYIEAIGCLLHDGPESQKNREPTYRKIRTTLNCEQKDLGDYIVLLVQELTKDNIEDFLRPHQRMIYFTNELIKINFNTFYSFANIEARMKNYYLEAMKKDLKAERDLQYFSKFQKKMAEILESNDEFYLQAVRIKLRDRIHNLRTLKHRTIHQKEKTIKESEKYFLTNELKKICPQGYRMLAYEIAIQKKRLNEEKAMGILERK